MPSKLWQATTGSVEQTFFAHLSNLSLTFGTSWGHGGRTDGRPADIRCDIVACRRIGNVGDTQFIGLKSTRAISPTRERIIQDARSGLECASEKESRWNLTRSVGRQTK